MAYKFVNKVGRYRTGKWNQRAVNKITKITVHHSAVDLKLGFTKEETLKNIQYTHEKVKGWPGASYHFVVFENEVWQINDFKDVTWHDSHNYDSIGVLVPGYFHAPYNNIVSTKTLATLKEFLDDLCTKHPEFPADQNDVYGHGERSATACPGTNLLPYVKEYRNKLGKVDWGGPNTLPQDTEADLSDDGNEFSIDKTKRMPEWLREELGLTQQYEWFKEEYAPDTLWDKTTDWYLDSKALELAKDRIDELEDRIRDLESTAIQKLKEIQDLDEANQKLASEMRLERQSSALTIEGLETRLKGLETQLEGIETKPDFGEGNEDIINRFNKMSADFEELSKVYAEEKKKNSIQRLNEELGSVLTRFKNLVSRMRDTINKYIVKK